MQQVPKGYQPAAVASVADRWTLSRLDAGELIRAARRAAGITQRELAARLDTSQPVISRWERGLDVPRVDTLGRILRACGYEADLVLRRRADEDRAQIAALLELTPAQRARHFRSMVDAYRHARMARKAVGHG